MGTWHALSGRAGKFELEGRVLGKGGHAGVSNGVQTIQVEDEFVDKCSKETVLAEKRRIQVMMHDGVHRV
jgi:hypothetical protein